MKLLALIRACKYTRLAFVASALVLSVLVAFFIGLGLDGNGLRISLTVFGSATFCSGLIWMICDKRLEKLEFDSLIEDLGEGEGEGEGECDE